MQYYGTRLSENISRREPEGYLLCLNVPVARTGVQEYLPEELGLPLSSFFLPSGSGAEGGIEGDRKALHTVPVLRPEAEVFSPETVASFEGMPVTDGHPPDGVTVDNIRALQKGHAHNVRRGSGDESDLLLADLIITDEGLIEAILGGKREISCGYTYELCEENGRYIQRRIRGNHVAVVDAGRAGHRVCIRDEQPSIDARHSRSGDGERRSDHKATIPERRKTIMNKSLLKKLTRMAKDGDTEAIEVLAEMAEQLVGPGNAETVVAVAAEPESETPAPAAGQPAGNPAPEESEPESARDDDALAAIVERLDRLIALLSPAGTDEEPEENPGALTAAQIEQVVAEVVENGVENGEDPGTIAETVAEVVAPEASAVIGPDGEGDCDRPLTAGDALRAALKSIRPALKRMSPAERVKVCADISAGLRKTGDSRVYAGMLSASRPQADPAELGERIMKARNINRR